MSNQARFFKLAYILIILTSGVIFFRLWDSKVRETGESRHYVTSAITLLNKGSISFDEDDIAYAESVFGKFVIHNFCRYKYKKNNFLKRFVTAPAKSEKFVGRSYYWGTYSALCVPVYWLCRTLHLFPDNMFNAFKLTNIILLLIPMVMIVFCLRASQNMKLLLLVFSAAAPAAQYINWASAEICIYMFVMLHLIFLYNRQYCRSALCFAFGASLNYCLFPLGVYLLWQFLKDCKKEYYDESTGKIRFTSKFFKKILLFGCCFLPVLHAAAFTFLQFRSIATMSGMAEYRGMLPRFLAYLLDLNFGILVYCHIFFLLFIVFMAVWLIRRQWDYFGAGLTFLCIVALYSIQHHINSGMEGIARYSCWSAPVMAFFVIDQLSQTRRQKIFYSVCGGIFLLNSLILLAPLHTPLRWGKVANFMLSHAPQYYNPPYSTFICRETSDGGGGYRYTQPVIFCRNNKFKILCSGNDLKRFWSFFSSDDKSVIDRINSRLGEQLQRKERRFRIDPCMDFSWAQESPKKEAFYCYINGSGPIYTVSFSFTYPRLRGIKTKIRENMLIIPPNGLQYGPYAEISGGRYKITVRGENLTCLNFTAYHNRGKTHVRTENLSRSPTEVSYVIFLDRDVRDMEFVSANRSKSTAVIHSISMKRMGTPLSADGCAALRAEGE